jgi:hypothetical protein
MRKCAELNQSSDATIELDVQGRALTHNPSNCAAQSCDSLNHT